MWGSNGILKTYAEMNAEQRLAYEMGRALVIDSGKIVKWCLTHRMTTHPEIHDCCEAGMYRGEDCTTELGTLILEEE